MLPIGKGRGRGRARGRGKDADQEKERKPGETSEAPRDVASNDDNPNIPKSQNLEKPSDQIIGKYIRAGRGRGRGKKREIDGGDQEKGQMPSATSQLSGDVAPEDDNSYKTENLKHENLWDKIFGKYTTADVASNEDNPNIPKSQNLEKPSDQIIGKYITAGRGRGRGRKREIEGGDEDKGQMPSPTSQHSGDVSSEDDNPYKTKNLKPENPCDQIFGKYTTAGRGRGRGRRREIEGDQDKGQTPSGTSQFSGVSKEDFAEMIASTSECKANSSTSISVGTKILPKSESKSTLPLENKLSLENKSPVNFTFAERPDYGKLGRRIEIFINYFMIYFKDVGIYHYDINILDVNNGNTKGRSIFSYERTAEEDRENQIKNTEREGNRNISKAKCRQIITEMIKSKSLRNFYPVYDGRRNLYTSKKLPYEEETSLLINVPLDNKSKQFFVSIQPVKKQNGTNIISLVPLKRLYSKDSTDIPYDVLSVYETILNYREPPFEDIQYKNTFFSLQQEKVVRLGSGLEIWFGYHQNVHLTELGPVVVINTAAKAFHKAGPVIDYVNEVLRHMHGERFPDIKNIPKLDGRDIEAISEALRGVRVKVTHQRHPRKYKITGLTDLSAAELTFEADHKRISVADYFWKIYGTKLSYAHLPCLEMQKREKEIYLPMETCVILEGQAKMGKLDNTLSNTMIGKTAVTSQERFDSISKYARKVEATSKDNLNAFNLIMDLTFLKVDGRIIASPQLEYGGVDKSRFAMPDKKGVWRLEDGKFFYKAIHVKNWVVISFANNKYFGLEVLQNFCQFLVKSANKCGMNLYRPNSINVYDRNIQTEEAILNAKKSGAEFAIVVLNRRDKIHTYDRVKFLSDFVHNLVTQCMEDKTLQRINDQITTNVCLKINVKLGGINHILFERPKFFTEPVLVIGADIIHWPRHYGYPSILSVVGSLDQMATKYALTCDLQRNKKVRKLSQEIIKNMDTVSKEMLEIFRDTNCWKTGIHPNKIIVFRDGVSEGQFQGVLEQEVGGIQKASYDLFQKMIPITYIVVQKRHQTRFRTVNIRDAGSGQNVPAGTTVDKTITHPVFFDYFLASHDGIRGTSKPAHYTVLHDDNHFKADELQQLSYFLCHTYVRCTRSVSLPAPILYADLSAYRAKKYADLHIPKDFKRTFGSEDVQRDLPSVVVKAIRSMKCFQNNMFYV